MERLWLGGLLTSHLALFFICIAWFSAAPGAVKGVLVGVLGMVLLGEFDDESLAN